MTRRMETLEEDQLLESLGTWWSTVLSSQPDGTMTQQQPGTSGGGARHPKKQPNSLCTTKGYWNMVGLVGWWRRLENEKSQESRTPSGCKLETDARLSFVKRFFPDLSKSSGGNTKLYRSGRVKPEVHSSRKLNSYGEEQNYPNFENLTPSKRKVGDGGMGSDLDSKEITLRKDQEFLEKTHR